MGLFNKFPYTDLNNINLDYTLNKINDLLAEGNRLYDALRAWQNQTIEENQLFKTQLLNDISTWETNLTASLEAWKDSVDQSVIDQITAAKAELLAYADTILAGAVAAKEAAEEAQAAAEAAEDNAEAAQEAAEEAQANAEAEAANISASSAQITANANDITVLKNALTIVDDTLDVTDRREAYPSIEVGEEVSFTTSAATYSYVDIIDISKDKHYTINVTYGSSVAASSTRNAVIVDSDDIVRQVIAIPTEVNSTKSVEFTASIDGTMIMAVDINYTDMSISHYTASINDIPELKNAIDTVSTIPDGYQQLNYIESSGTQLVINTTGTHSATQNSHVNIKFAIPTGVTSTYLFGSREAAGSKGFYGQLTAGKQIYCGYGNKSVMSGVFAENNRIYELDFDKGALSIDGELKASATVSAFTTPSNCRLFGIRGINDSTTLYYGIVRIYRYREWDGDTLISDLIPVKNVSTGVCYMYNLVNSKFMGNVKTGSLISGGDVNVQSIRESDISASVRLNGIQDDIKNLTSEIEIKDYVQTEADAVSERVRNVQTSKSITFAAISDMHYSVDSAAVRTALGDMASGLKAIAGQTKIDFYVSFGDMIWRLSSDGDFAKGKVEMIGMTKLLNDAFGNNPQIRIVGNHDPNAEGSTGYFTAQQLNAFTNLYSDMIDLSKGVYYPGYGYVDFNDHKLRLIVLNTSYYGAHETPTQNSTQYSFGTTQAQWLAETLDLSAKSDAQDWQIMIFSHVALDYTAQTNIGKHSAILNAYENGSTWTDGNYSYNFSGKNAAKLALYINGHAHKYMWRNMRNVNSSGTLVNGLKMACIYVPNALPDRDEQSKDGVTYTKTANTAESTAFQIITIDPNTKKVYAHHYGAGIDIIMHYESQNVSSSTTLTSTLTSPSWHSNNEAIATVTDGSVTPVASGVTMIWAKSETDNCVEAWNLRVTV